MSRRNKVGGINDRRFGENDPTMTPDEKMLERFTQEKQRHFKHGAMFNLEEDEEEYQLTHFGQSLSLGDANTLDDFNEDDIRLSDAEANDNENGYNPHKRQRDVQHAPHEDEILNGEPERKKSKAEVMKEVIAKSKFHKYERQAAKDEDEDLRLELDKELPNLYALLQKEHPKTSSAPADTSHTNPDRASLLGATRDKNDAEYDMRLREMVLDKRSKPTERTRTEKEILEAEAARLQRMEAKRLRRMRGEAESSDGSGDDEDARSLISGNDADTFGIGPGIPNLDKQETLGVEEEDEFLIDHDLVASSSNDDSLDIEVAGYQSQDESIEEDGISDGVLSPEDSVRIGRTVKLEPNQLQGRSEKLAFTFACPESHGHLLNTLSGISIWDQPIVIQRIRALHHPKLNSDNREKMAKFCSILVDHLAYLMLQPTKPPFEVIEGVIRHIQSLSRSYPLDIARAFRDHINQFQQQRPMSPSPADLILLSAIGTIFSTSDHFHQVVTPAMLCMTRYLGQKVPANLNDLAVGAYFGTLILHYQRMSKRYIPEIVNFTLNALCALAPAQPKVIPGNFPYHKPVEALRLQGQLDDECYSLKFWDIFSSISMPLTTPSIQNGLIIKYVELIDAMATMWFSKLAFIEVFEGFLEMLQHLSGKSCHEKLADGTRMKIRSIFEKLQRLLNLSRLSRRPLELHHHRPLPIKTAMPKFEESYNPDKHYDPDRERAEVAKLKAEHKRERKGALRELRKDASFIAREALKEKKERDVEYEKKYKRLIAEIQGEEGREAKAYEREKAMRKNKR
jgi:nucleolar protein 14